MLREGQDTTKSYINAADQTPGHKLYQNDNKVHQMLNRR